MVAINLLSSFVKSNCKRPLLPLFALFLGVHYSYSQCNPGEFPVAIAIVPDDYPGETSWHLYENNIEVASGTINSANVCVDANACIRFEILDSYGDGICCSYGQGSYAVSLNGTQVASGGQFAFSASHSFNCPQGTICENPFPANAGANTALEPNTFFEFIPDSTGVYLISTCGTSSCDTKLWVYDNCSEVVMDNSATGAMYFNDNSCGLQSEISALLTEGQPYIIRVGANDLATCLSDIVFNISYESAMSSVLPIVKLTTVGSAINNDIKVPVHMEIIDNGPGQLNFVTDQNYSYEGNIMAELQGFTGPSYPKKNYDFDLVDANGIKIDTSLLGLPAENDWVFKAEYLDHSLLINSVTYEFARRMGRYAPRTRQCEIFLDGIYIGVYTLTEKVKRDQNRLDIAKMTTADTAGSALSGGYIIEMNINGEPGAWNSAYAPINSATCQLPVEFKYVYPKADSILPVQQNYIKTYVDSFENALNANTFESPTLGYRNWIDVSTFIDFLIVNEFSMNYDSYGRSTYMYKEKDTDGGKLCIGPPWDYDRAMANDPNSGWVWENTHLYWPFPFWWSKMYSDSTYRHELACRWLSLRQDVFKTERFMEFIDSAAYPLLQGPAVRNFSVWQDIDPSQYENQVLNIKNFLSNRLNWMDDQLAGFGAVLPNIVIPTDTLVCKGTIFTAPFDSLYSYNWIPGPETPEIVLDSAGNYNLVVKDDFGCYSKQTMQVELSMPNAAFSVSNNSNDPTIFFTAVDPNLPSYQWNFGDGYSFTSTDVNDCEHIYANPGAYWVELNVLDNLGCNSKTSQYLNIQEGELVFEVFPNPIGSGTMMYHNLPIDDEFEFALTDETGRLIKRWKNPASPFSLGALQLSHGCYYLTCYYKKLVTSRTLIAIE